MLLKLPRLATLSLVGYAFEAKSLAPLPNRFLPACLFLDFTRFRAPKIRAGAPARQIHHGNTKQNLYPLFVISRAGRSLDRMFLLKSYAKEKIRVMPRKKALLVYF